MTAFGQTRGRIQYEIDGYVLDPMDAGTYDIARVEMINIAGLRVERRLDVTRVKITTASAVSGTPYSRVEAATGEPDMNAFRGLFLAPSVAGGPLAAALDRVDTDGLGGDERASTLTGWLKWSWTNGNRGIQLEYRRQGLQREENSPWPAENTKSDLILRARSRFGTALTAEIFGGLSSFRAEAPDTGSSTVVVPDSLRIPALERDHFQAGARAAFNRGGLSLGRGQP